MRFVSRTWSFGLALLTTPVLSVGPATAAEGSAPPPAAVTAPAPAPAIGIEPFGYFFSRYERRANYGYEGFDGADFVRYRAQFGIQTTRIPLNGDLTLQARIAPQVGGFWHVGGDGLEDPVLGLHEGYLKVEGPKGRLQVGRFEMSYGEELVIGTVGWNQIGRAFDGIRFHLQPKAQGPWVDLFATQLGEGTVEAVPSGDLAAGDRYFLGVYAGLGPWISKSLELDVYALNVLYPGYEVADAAAPETGSELTLGSRVKGKGGPIDYRAEAGLQLGSRRVETVAASVMAYQVDAEVGLTLPVAAGLRIGLEGLYASGDDPDSETIESWNQLFPTAHKWLGFMDVIGGRSNVASGVLHLRLSPIKPVAIVIDGHTFLRPQQPEGVESYVGSELDTGVIWSLGKAFSIRGAYDIFLPAEDFGDKTLHFVELEFLSRF